MNDRDSPGTWRSKSGRPLQVRPWIKSTLRRGCGGALRHSASAKPSSAVTVRRSGAVAAAAAAAGLTGMDDETVDVVSWPGPHAASTITNAQGASTGEIRMAHDAKICRRMHARWPTIASRPANDRYRLAAETPISSLSTPHSPRQRTTTQCFYNLPRWYRDGGYLPLHISSEVGGCVRGR